MRLKKDSLKLKILNQSRFNSNYFQGIEHYLLLKYKERESKITSHFYRSHVIAHNYEEIVEMIGQVNNHKDLDDTTRRLIIGALMDELVRRLSGNN